MRQGEVTKENIDIIECNEFQEKLDPLKKIKSSSLFFYFFLVAKQAGYT